MYPSFNYDILPKVVLWLGHESKIFEREVWTSLEKVIWENLHLFTFDQLCLIEYGSQVCKPKYFSGKLNKTIFEKCKEQLEAV